MDRTFRPCRAFAFWMETSRRLSAVPRPKAAEEPAGLEGRSDDELMLLARGGLEAAFAALILRHQAHTLRLAVRYSYARLQ